MRMRPVRLLLSIATPSALVQAKSTLQLCLQQKQCCLCKWRHMLAHSVPGEGMQHMSAPVSTYSLV